MDNLITLVTTKKQLKKFYLCLKIPETTFLVPNKLTFLRLLGEVGTNSSAIGP